MRIVFCGDSLTEGADGASYLLVLAERVRTNPRLAGIELVNAGVGGDTIVNLARRIERDVVPHQPDWVVVFLGVNDCTTYLLPRSLPTLSNYRSRRYFRRDKGVRQPITPERFRDGLRIVVEGIRARTPARVAICTASTFGESLHSRAWRVLGRYAAMARLVASERGCSLVDVRVAFERELGGLPERSLATRFRALALRRPQEMDSEILARRRAYALTYDGVHFNGRGAALVAGVFEEWLLATIPLASCPAPRS